MAHIIPHKSMKHPSPNRANLLRYQIPLQWLADETISPIRPCSRENKANNDVLVYTRIIDFFMHL